MANTEPEDAELEDLLTRLLRMVSPGFTADGGIRVSQGGQPADEAGLAVVIDATAPPPQSDMPASGEADPALPISASEARALIELVAARGIAQGELAALLGLDKSTVSRLAASLERKGWVKRGRDEANQRYVRLYLTPQGGEVAARVWRAWHSRQARILASLSADERVGLTAGLRGLIRGMSAEGLLSQRAGHSG
jgi:DNA-binding MarR family transcriptional regulator